jgi:hypothetical protein
VVEDRDQADILGLVLRGEHLAKVSRPSATKWQVVDGTQVNRFPQMRVAVAADDELET